MNGDWNVSRTHISKFFKLKNNQWLKIMFTYVSSLNKWIMDICVANSKRECNDCFFKTEKSPKVLYGHITGNRAGMEPFIISLKSLLDFEKEIGDCEIVITGASDRLTKIYSRLKRYGYNSRIVTFTNGKQKEVFYKQIKLLD